MTRPGPGSGRGTGSAPLQQVVEPCVLRIHFRALHGVDDHRGGIRRSVRAARRRHQPVVVVGRHQHELASAVPRDKRRAWVERSAQVFTPVDYYAQGLLAAVAAACGGGIVVPVTPQWSEPLLLWQALVGPASSGKSPALAAARRLVDGIAVEGEPEAGPDPAAPPPAVEPATKPFPAALAPAPQAATPWRGRPWGKTRARR